MFKVVRKISTVLKDPPYSTKLYAYAIKKWNYFVQNCFSCKKKKGKKLKSLFVLFRYLDRLPRYKDSKRSWNGPKIMNGPLSIFLGNAYYVLPSISYVSSRNRVCRLPGIWDRSVRREDRVSDKTNTEKYLLLYTRISREPKVVSR